MFSFFSVSILSTILGFLYQFIEYPLYLLKNLFINDIKIIPKKNPVLVSCLTEYMKKHSLKSTQVVLENGKEILQDHMIFILWPPIIVKINQNFNKRASYFNGETDCVYIYILFHYYSTKGFIKLLLDNYNESTNKYIELRKYCGYNEDWCLEKRIECIPPNIFYNKNFINEVTTKIDFFLNNKKFYNDMNLTYKLSFLFYGIPGTGKTTFIKWLAIKYSKNIYTVNANDFFEISGDEKEKYVKPSGMSLRNCSKNIVLFEDIDRFFQNLKDKEKSIDTSQFLNFLDGLGTPENIIIILTANNIDSIPSEVLRDGRIDKKIFFDELPLICIKQIYKHYNVPYNPYIKLQKTVASHMSYIYDQKIK